MAPAHPLQAEVEQVQLLLGQQEEATKAAQAQAQQAQAALGKQEEAAKVAQAQVCVGGGGGGGGGLGQGLHSAASSRSSRTFLPPLTAPHPGLVRPPCTLQAAATKGDHAAEVAGLKSQAAGLQEEIHRLQVRGTALQAVAQAAVQAVAQAVVHERLSASHQQPRPPPKKLPRARPTVPCTHA